MTTITAAHIVAGAELAGEMISNPNGSFAARSAEIAVKAGLTDQDVGAVFKLADALHGLIKGAIAAQGSAPDPDGSSTAAPL